MVSKTVEKTIGTKNRGTNVDVFTTDKKVVSKYVFADDAKISKLTLYVCLQVAGTANIKGVIYSDSGGAPNTLLATSAETVCDWTTPLQLRDLTFSSPIELNAGTYWIGFIYESATSLLIRHVTGSTNQWAENADDYTDGASNPFGVPSYQAWALVVYATYTTSITMKYPPSIRGYEVATVTNPKAVMWQEKSFNAEGRIWIFYVTNSIAYFTTSTDGETWATPTSLYTVLHDTGGVLQAILEVKGSSEYVHVFARVEDGPFRNIMYRRGLLNSDGTITWTADWAVAWQVSVTQVDFYAVLDSNGYPWITWGYGVGVANICTYITKSSNNNGIWATAGGYPVALTSVYMGEYIANNFVVALTDGKLYAFYFRSKNQIKGKLWNGVVWSAEETCTTSNIIEQYAAGYETWSRGVTVDSEDNIHLIFVDYVEDATYPTFSYNLRYVKRTYGVGWGAETVVEADILYKNVSPAITLYNNEPHIFWTSSPAKNVIFRKVLDEDGYWSRVTYYVEEVTDTIPNVDYYGYDSVINAFPKLYGNKIGLMWISNPSGIYKLKFGFKSIGYAQSDTTDFDTVMKTFEQTRGAPSLEVTLRTLSLGTRDSTTGWYAKDYTDSTIKMYIATKGSNPHIMGVGYYVSLDALGFTKELVNVYDQIVDAANRVWEIKAVTPIAIGDVLKFYTCDLKELPLYE
jgi:hypothetical protein